MADLCGFLAWANTGTILCVYAILGLFSSPKRVFLVLMLFAFALFGAYFLLELEDGERV